MNELALQIKNSVSINIVFQSVGLTKNRGGFVVCPFHNEKTPSLKLFNNNTYYCFGCGKGGDVIKFYEDYYGESFIEAIKHINSDYHLGLSVGEKQNQTFEQRLHVSNLKKNEIIQKAKNAEIERLKLNHEKWIAKWIEADKIISNNSPKSEKEISNEFIEAIKNINFYAYMIDCCENEIWRKKNE